MIADLKKAFLFLLAFVFFASCTLLKRNYRSGYHVAWNGTSSEVGTKGVNGVLKNEKSKVAKRPELRSNIVQPQQAEVNSLIASNAKGPKLIYTGPKTFIDNCDTLVLRNGTEIKAKVVEITPTEVKYRYCDNPDGPLIVVAKNDVEYVIFANGERDHFKIEGNATTHDMGSWPAGDLAHANKEAKDSQLMGILAFPGIFIYGAGFVLAILAIIKGRSALRVLKRNPKENYQGISKARTGIILGSILLGLAAVVVIAVFAFAFGVI